MKRRDLFRLVLASPAAWLVSKYGLPANVDHTIDHTLQISMPGCVQPGDILIACVSYWHEGKRHEKTSTAIVGPDGSIGYPQLDLALPGPVPAVGAMYAIRPSDEPPHPPEVVEFALAESRITKDEA